MTSNKDLDNFLSDLKQQRKFKKFLKKGAIEYDIRKYNSLDLTTSMIQILYKEITDKYSSKNGRQIKNSFQERAWMPHQLKVFVWVTICCSYLYEIQLSQLIQVKKDFFVSVFFFKSLEIIEFQILSLIKSSSKKWTSTEEQILSQLSNDESLLGKWNEISRLLYLKSDKKFFRKPQKCREHFINHLNRQISKDPWSMDQDKMLIEKVMKIGKKWSQISKIFQGKRTEHMIKNRYLSLQKKYRRNLKVYLIQIENTKNSVIISTQMVQENYEQISRALSNKETDCKQIECEGIIQQNIWRSYEQQIKIPVDFTGFLPKIFTCLTNQMEMEKKQKEGQSCQSNELSNYSPSQIDSHIEEQINGYFN